MVNELINLRSKRAYEARLSKLIGKKGYTWLVILGTILGTGAIGLGFSVGLRYSILLASPTFLCIVSAIWWKRYLSILPVTDNSLTGRLSIDVLSRIKPGSNLSPKELWAALSNDWQANFIFHHLLLTKNEIALQLESADVELTKKALDIASNIAYKTRNETIELGFIVAGLMIASPTINQLVVRLKGRPSDIEAVANWLGRYLIEYEERQKQNFGGIGRDWAFGFTPLLNRLGLNVSLTIAKHGSHFGWLMDSIPVNAIEGALNNHSLALAVIGPVGIGKSSIVYAFAERLIEGKTSKSLAYHQVISINATDIVSNARGPGDLENIMISLANEASHAGHIILFLDDAEAFFSTAPGSFDASQILQSIIQPGSLPLIIAITANGFEKLKARNPSLASLMTPIVVPELEKDGVMRVLEDTAIGLESKNQVLITYEALHEAYNLSGRYNQDEAYPGKAIKLLQQAVTYSIKSVVTDKSVQLAIEQTKGVKLGSAAPAEASELLNLEAKIHERMINQTHAVSVIANSLRRARAGVNNPKRPIGSFLFLGPTGVGKTELAKSLAASYFGAESNMIRLDMSEYQQEADVSRLLSDGTNETKSLIMSARQQPFSVILLDEIEKAHPNILNLMLQLLDEGQLTDTSGRAVSFKDSIIIATSNAGSQSIRDHVDKGEALESFEPELIEELIKSNQFKPELINRFDEIVLFRPLKPEELAQVVELMLSEINKTLSSQNISISLTAEAIKKIVSVGYDPKLGARPMRRTLQRAVEDTVAQKILKNEAKPGDHLTLDSADLSL